MHQRAAWILFVYFGVLEWMVCAPLSEQCRRRSLKHRQKNPHQTPGIGFSHTPLSFHADFLFSHGFKGSYLLTFIRQLETTDKSYSEVFCLVIQLLLSWSFWPNKQLVLTNFVEKLIFSLDKGADVEFVNSPFCLSFNWVEGEEKKKCNAPMSWRPYSGCRSSERHDHSLNLFSFFFLARLMV